MVKFNVKFPNGKKTTVIAPNPNSALTKAAKKLLNTLDPSIRKYVKVDELKERSVVMNLRNKPIPRTAKNWKEVYNN